MNAPSCQHDEAEHQGAGDDRLEHLLVEIIQESLRFSADRSRGRKVLHDKRDPHSRHETERREAEGRNDKPSPERAQRKTAEDESEASTHDVEKETAHEVSEIIHWRIRISPASLRARE